ncbi:MAG: NAD(P)(+) transhydrogenase (Re/Si-specific) subunit alpha, partial [Bacteroidota bacterium]
MKIGILKEDQDRRVSLTPDTLAKNAQLVAQYLLEKDAGQSAGYADAAYGDTVSVHDRATILREADLIVSIHPPNEADLAQIKPQTVLVSLFQPYFDQEVSDRLRQRTLRAFSLDMIPRTTLAQAMDVLSSMASVSGYQAVLMAANHLPRYFPMMITAAGSIRPAKVLVLGAGVAGLQAIATAKRLGAMVEAFDVRKAAKEEVESLGAKF